MKIRKGDIITVEMKDEKTGHLWTKKRVSYKVIALYRYFVLCQHCKAGYLRRYVHTSLMWSKRHGISLARVTNTGHDTTYTKKEGCTKLRGR